EHFTFSESGMKVIRAAAEAIEGTKYDPGDLVDMLLRQLGYLPKKGRLFNFGMKRVVCSVGVQTCLMKWWQEIGRENECPRPLGWQWVEDAAPADLVMHKTFTVIKQIKRPKGGWNRG
ncbi:unnamed protein product, partial [marine sediment metagenome]